MGQEIGGRDEEEGRRDYDSIEINLKRTQGHKKQGYKQISMLNNQIPNCLVIEYGLLDIVWLLFLVSWLFLLKLLYTF